MREQERGKAQMSKNQTKGTLKGATALELYSIVDHSFIVKFFLFVG